MCHSSCYPAATLAARLKATLVTEPTYNTLALLGLYALVCRGGPTLLAAIGNDKTGGIAVLRPGLITDLMVEQQLPAVHGMWAIRHRSGLSLDSFRSPCPCLKNKEKWTGCKGFAYPRTLDQGLLPPMWHPCPSWKYSYGIDVHGLLPLMWHPCPSWIGSRAWIYVELMLDSCP
eukprot:scaffold121215_cov17-Tisochrysis_lutea.AAC.1